MIRVLIVDDEQVVREDLILLFEGHKDFIVVGACGTIKEAAILVSTTRPDVLLLDIQLTDGTGFDLLQSLEKVAFHIIFITAFDRYAIQAIKYGALDYLLKPFDEQELWAALQKACSSPMQEEHFRSSLHVARSHYNAQDRSRWDRIALSSQQTLQVISFDEILYCEGNASYTHFFLTDHRKMVVSKNLKEYEQLLPLRRFLRCHQSYLVNAFYIDHFHIEGYLALKGGQQVPVSRRKKEQVISFLSGNQTKCL